MWSFKEEAIKYCEQDCRSLHQVISKYNVLFFNNFGFNIHKSPTISSLAFANYRTNFMEKENIANLYYSDTDSIYIDKPLPDSFISNTVLGKLKLEKICKRVIFLAPKIYILSGINNNIEIKIKGVTKKAILENNINLSLFVCKAGKIYYLKII